MHEIVRAQLNTLRGLCEKHRAKRLELFGSAAEGGFAADTSDLDFLVEFDELSPVEHAASYFGLLADLEDLFGRSIDLVEASAIRNPYVLQELDRTREVLFAA